jgi:hypothetical protein
MCKFQCDLFPESLIFAAVYDDCMESILNKRLKYSYSGPHILGVAIPVSKPLDCELILTTGSGIRARTLRLGYQ